MKTRLCGYILLTMFSSSVLIAQSSADYVIATNQGAAVITKYIGSGGAVDIPDCINGLPVVSIGDYAFVYCKSLSGLIIPTTVTNIGHIGFGACSSLLSVAIPDSVVRIGGSAFQYCTSLKQVSLGSGLVSIGERAFGDCPSLTGFTVDPLNTKFTSVGGALLSHDQRLFVQCPGGKVGSYSVPETVVSLANSAFFGCASVEYVQLPMALTSIGDSAFFGCSSLLDVSIPAAVTNIESRAFDSCPRLTAINVDESNARYLSWNGVLLCREYGYSLVQYPAGKTESSYTIPDEVTAVNYRGFSMCVNLNSITLPSSMVYLGERAFSGCVGLRSLRFGGNAPTISSRVFEEVTDATVYCIPGTSGWGDTFGGLPVVPWDIDALAIVGFRLEETNCNLTISGPADIQVVVEANHSLSSSNWVPIANIDLAGGLVSFNDPEGVGHLSRFYRIRRN